MSAPAKTNTTPHARVREWATEYAREHDTVATKEIVTAAQDHFINDEDFAHLLWDWAYEQLVPKAVKEALKGGRVPLSDGRTISHTSLAARAADTNSLWDAWRRSITHTTDSGEVIDLPDMRREHLIDEHIKRRGWARQSLIEAAFLKSLADRIGDDGETVSDTFTPAELRHVLNTIRERFTRGDA